MKKIQLIVKSKELRDAIDQALFDHNKEQDVIEFGQDGASLPKKSITVLNAITTPGDGNNIGVKLKKNEVWISGVCGHPEEVGKAISRGMTQIKNQEAKDVQALED